MAAEKEPGMSKIFEAVQAMSGQGNCITIPAPYLDYFAGDPQAHLLGAILNQLVFWSGKASTQGGGWFYKAHDELASEIRGVTGEQVRKAVKKLITAHLNDVIFTAKRKVNGTPTMHYRVDGDALIGRLFPDSLETAILPNGNVNIDESKRQYRRMETAELPNPGNGNIAESYLYTDHYTEDHKQIIKPVGRPAAPADEQQAGSLKIDYQAVLAAYHEILPEMPKVIGLTDKRRTRLNGLWKKFDFNQDRWMAYLRFIAKNCRWMLEDRPDACTGKTWRKKNFDYLITEDCYLAVKEERANDLPKVAKVNHAERDDAFKRLIEQRGKPQNAVEELAKAAAGKAGLGRMNEVMARASWKGIWTEAVQQILNSEMQRSA